jgi:hypothetical protein
MRIIYNRKTKKYELEVSILDKCYTCGNQVDCPLLSEIDNQNILMRKDNFYKEKCSMYFYYISKELEEKTQGFYLGNEDDRGYTDNYKYR